MESESEDRVLRIQQVIEITGLSRSTIYAYSKDGFFPKQRQIGMRAVGWYASQVFRWLAERDVAR